MKHMIKVHIEGEEGEKDNGGKDEDFKTDLLACQLATLTLAGCVRGIRMKDIQLGADSCSKTNNGWVGSPLWAAGLDTLK